MGLSDGGEGFGKVVGRAASHILGAGQLMIAGMRATTGEGEPDRGDAFGQAAAVFSGAAEAVRAAAPRDEWLGGGAESYAPANRRQAERAGSLAVLDRTVQTVLTREARQVARHREQLDDQSEHLADLGRTTASMASIPGIGNAMKAAVELTAVHAALDACSVELGTLHREAEENAAELRRARR